MDADHCHYCGGPATHLCDYVIGREKAGTAKYPGRPAYDYVDENSQIFTCDRPLCEACAIHVGNKFFSWKGGGEVVSDDRCPDHADTPMCVEIITEDEAVARRLRAEFKVTGDHDAKDRP